ncbi:hypothetical protein NC653_037890 [Populus alba x Populus x berolinensis]|uniref:Uncharacterized protein n=1 Tax=Populus alba x Populus x berolinensis TaxID=444605 RepID=A0AAD6LFI5_9ROSI|nr:hypothetical protein NC653_037890 [Populus alba x Populus x berolinensis]
MGGAPLVLLKAEWVSACEGEREIVAEGLWRFRRRWVAGSIGLAGTPLLGGGADRKNRGKDVGEGLKVCVGLGDKREEVGEAVVAGGLGFSSWFVLLAVEKGECRGSKWGR